MQPANRVSRNPKLIDKNPVHALGNQTHTFMTVLLPIQLSFRRRQFSELAITEQTT